MYDEDDSDRLTRPRVARHGQDVTLGDRIQRGRRFVDDDKSCCAVVRACVYAVCNIMFIFGLAGRNGSSRGLTPQGVASLRLWV